MSLQKKLVNKLQRRQRKVREGTRKASDMDKQDETLVASPAAFKVMRGVARRVDESFGYDAVGHEPMLEYKAEAATTERFDYDPGAGFDYGIRLTMAAGMIEAIGVQAGDTVEVREQGSELEGRMLTVVEVTDSTHLRLDDVATYVGPESDNAMRFLLSAQKKSFV